MNPIEQYATSPGQKAYLAWRGLWTVVVVLGMMSCCAVILLVCHILTFGRSRRFGMNVIARHIARLILWCCGIRVHVEGHHWPRTPAVYITNHTSTLDFFIVTSLGLPNIRAFMSVKNRTILPIWLMGRLLGHFFIPTQDDPAGRTACFQDATATLKASQDSVFLTPEGTRHIDGKVGPFNKGAFHLATALGLPIVPLFIEIAPQMNPGKGFKTRPGDVTVHVGQPIDTTTWSVDTVEQHRDHMHQHYVDWHHQLTQ